MLCAKLASRRDGVAFPCGQCLNCRINKRRDWQSRLLLEAASHEYSVFVTLTFRDTGVPEVLRRDPAKLFYRRLRERYPDIRHFTAAEYGTKSGRAHFHAHIFSNEPIPDGVISESWPFGSVHIGDTQPESIDYVLGYLLKGRKVHVWPVEQRFPEFRMFSKGLGKLALPDLLIDGHELPREFRVFGKTWPIGRYLRDRAKNHGFAVSDRKETVLEALEAKALRAVLVGEKATPEQVDEAYRLFWQNREAKRKVMQQKAIRAAYLERHGYSNLRMRKNETL